MSNRGSDLETFGSDHGGVVAELSTPVGNGDAVGGIGLGHHRVGVDPVVGVVTCGVVDKVGTQNCLDNSD